MTDYETKITEIKKLLNDVACNEAIFILGSIMGEVEAQKTNKAKSIIFKI